MLPRLVESKRANHEQRSAAAFRADLIDALPRVKTRLKPWAKICNRFAVPNRLANRRESCLIRQHTPGKPRWHSDAQAVLVALDRA